MTLKPVYVRQSLSGNDNIFTENRIDVVTTLHHDVKTETQVFSSYSLTKNYETAIENFESQIARFNEVKVDLQKYLLSWLEDNNIRYNLYVQLSDSSSKYAPDSCKLLSDDIMYYVIALFFSFEREEDMAAFILRFG